MSITKGAYNEFLRLKKIRLDLGQRCSQEFVMRGRIKKSNNDLLRMDYLKYNANVFLRSPTQS